MLFSHFLSLALLTATAAAIPRKTPRGFVTTSGTKFKLDGKDFYFAGSNAYYFPFMNVSLPPQLSSMPLP
jgi:mannan endo-1,4-beta-mannosidase